MGLDYADLLGRDFLAAYLPAEGTDFVIRMAIAFVVGACVGSFLNVVALRSLLQKSWLFPGSHCLNCEKPLQFFDMIPIVSYFLLGGKCRNCKEKFSWQYPLVEFATGLTFAAMLWKFGYTMEGVAMCLFAATLITVTVTDFREHLIPHEITYPSILVGLGYYSLAHGNPGGALIGAGISYILFDFMDFYGRYVVGYLRGGDDEELTDGASPWVNDPTYDLKEQYFDPDEGMVMGGGDAVLSAVIACWIGWEKMAMAVVIAFLVGALMGAVYLLRDMQKRDVLKNATGPAIKGFIIGAALLAIPLVLLGYMTQNPEMFMTPQLLILASLSGLAGGLFGAVMSGTKRFDNHFPFGPSLAIGGLLAILVPSDTWYSGVTGGISYLGGWL